MNTAVETFAQIDATAALGHSTGADMHETNGPIYSYRLHCAFGNIGDAGEAKRTMYRRARELMRRHDRA